MQRTYPAGYGSFLTPTRVKYPDGFPDNRFRMWPPRKWPDRYPPVPPSPSVISTRATKGSRFQSISSRASSSGTRSMSPVFFPSAPPSTLSSGSSLGDTVSHCWCCPSQQSSDCQSTLSTPTEATAPHPALLQLQAIAQRAAAIAKVPPPVSLSPASSSPASSRPEQPWFCDVPGCLNHQYRPSSPSKDFVSDSPGVRSVPIDDDNDDFAAPPGLPADSTFPQELFQKFLAACRAAGGRRLPSPSASPSDRHSSSGDLVSESLSQQSLSGDDNAPIEFDPDAGFVDDSFDSVYTPGDLSESPLPDSPTGSVICFRTEPTIRHYTTLEPAPSPGFFARCGQILDAAVSKAAAWVRSWF